MSDKKRRPGPTGRRSESQAAAKPPILTAESMATADGSAPLTLAELGRLLREEGIARANAGADRWWRATFDTAVDYLAATGREWTTDDLFALGVPAPDHPNRVGARINAAHKAGLIRPVGYRLSGRPSRHAGVVRVWTGAQASEAAA